MQTFKKSAQIDETIDKNLPSIDCIDDFATKKRYSYGTVMTDAQNGVIIDIFESRESEEVSAWRAAFLNTVVVSRDASTMYAKAISTAYLKVM